MKAHTTADLAFSLFVLFVSQINIAKDGMNQPDWGSAHDPTEALLEISNRLLTPACVRVVANHARSFELLVELLCGYRRNSNVQVCLSTLILHYPSIAIQLVDEGFLQLLSTRRHAELLCEQVVETMLAVLLEQADPADQLVLQSVLGHLIVVSSSTPSRSA
jgi:hypothetical protein